MSIFCMPGSWNWAKNQMIAGRMVRSAEWTSHLKLRLNPQTKRVEVNFLEHETNATDDSRWLPAPLLSESFYAAITNYQVVKWETKNEIFIYPELLNLLNRSN